MITQRLFYRCFYFCTPSTLVTLYSSFIRPHLEYACCLGYVLLTFFIASLTFPFLLTAVAFPNFAISTCKIVKIYLDFRYPLLFLISQHQTFMHLSYLCSLHSIPLFFFPHTTSLWNFLSNDTVNSSSLAASFKNLLSS